jgi:multidrug efflux system membrane fusion protein
MNATNRSRYAPFRLAGLLVVVVGCSSSEEAPKTVIPNVTVSYPVERRITDHAEYPGRTAAVESVQIRARVSGYLEKINFKDGAEVSEGEILYEIDPRPY